MSNDSLASDATASRQGSQDWRAMSGREGVEVACVTVGEHASSPTVALKIVAERIDSGASAAVSRRIDATSYLGDTVILSARLLCERSVVAPALWLRADGPSGPLEFATTAAIPDTCDALMADREVALRVPTSATALVYGIVFGGYGAVDAQDLALRTADPHQFGAQATPAEVMETALTIISSEALHAHEIDWASMHVSARQAVAAARRSVDVYPAIRHAIQALGDRHSRFVTPEAAYRHRIIGLPTKDVDVRCVAAGVGYVAMPGFVGVDETASLAFVDDVAGRLLAIAAEAHKGWVLDLRDNIGGNLWPMLAAVKGLLGTGIVGYFKPAAKEARAWRAGDRLPTSDAIVHASCERSPVAVLLGPRTCSSGEALAIAFHGRMQTRSFGAATAGLSSANATFNLPDASQLQLTTAVCVDRHGQAFGHGIEPDIPARPVQGSVYLDGGDSVLDAAIAWLLEIGDDDAAVISGDAS